MPGMSGRELAERSSPRGPDIRVLYMSGYTDDADHPTAACSAPGSTILHKPFTPELLARTVRESLDVDAS